MAPVMLEIQPMSLLSVMDDWRDDELEDFQDLLNTTFNAECTILGFKKDPETGSYAKVPKVQPDLDTLRWAGSRGKQWEPAMCSKATADWPFGVAYISVKDLSKAEKIIKEFKEIPAYAFTVIQIKIVDKADDYFAHRNTPPSLQKNK